MIIPGCIYHRAGLRPMRETRRAQSAGFEYTELRFPSWECESPDCDGLYDNNAGYYVRGQGKNWIPCCQSYGAEETRCEQHKVQMLAIAQECEVITFQCPYSYCSNHCFVPRASLRLE